MSNPETDWATELVNAKLPCICISAYKDRGRIQPDCPRCNYGEEMAELVRGGYARGVEEAAKAVCWMCREGEIPWTVEGDLFHGSTPCSANTILALARTGAEGKQDA